MPALLLTSHGAVQVPARHVSACVHMNPDISIRVGQWA